MAVDPTQINNSLNSQLPDNNTGRITPAVLRTALTTGTGLGLLGLTGWIVATFAPISTTLPHVPNNAALQAIVPSAGQVYVRDGLNTPGDGYQATYVGLTTNCTAPDNQTQVQPTGTGCWNVSTQFVQGGISAPLGYLESQNALPPLPPCLVGDSITEAGNNYNQYFFTASGGTGPYTFSVAGLPSGITTNTSSPSLIFQPGIYTAGTYAVTVTVTDSASHIGTFSYSLNAPIWNDLIFTLTTSTPGSLSFALSTVDYELPDRGPAYWINFLSNGAVKIPKSNIFAHPGDTTANVLSRMGQITAAAPQCGAYTLMIGTNDLGGTLATIENNIWSTAAPLTSIVGQMLQTGRPVFLQTLLPRSLGNPSTPLYQLHALNRWIRSLAGTVPNLRIVDGSQAYGDPLDPTGAPRTYSIQIIGEYGNGNYTYSISGVPTCLTINSSTGVLSSTCTSASTSAATISISDTASHTGSQPWTVNINPSQSQPISAEPSGSITGSIGMFRLWDYSYDGLHPKTPGAYAAFAPLANALMLGVPAYNQANSGYTEFYNSTSNPLGNLIVANGGQMTAMAGTGATSGRVSGTVADGWTAYSVDASCSVCTYTAVSSMGTLSDGTPADVLTLGGTASGGFGTVIGLSYITSSLPPFTTGDSLVASCRVEVSGAQHISDVWTELVYTAGGVNYNIESGSAGGLNPSVSDLAPEGVSYAGLAATPWPDAPNAPLKTYPTLPGALSGLINLVVNVPITNGPSGTVAGVVKVGGCAITHG